VKSRLLIALLALSSAAWSADWEFDRVVNAIEHQYGVRRQHIPLMGLANFVLKVVRPGGATGFKLAVFEDLKSDEQDLEAMDRFMDKIGESNMHRLLRAHSQRGSESAYLYLSEPGRSTKMLLVTFGRNEATVVQVNLNIDALMKLLSNPSLNRHEYCCSRHDDSM
jgi:hypothetical protein